MSERYFVNEHIRRMFVKEYKQPNPLAYRLEGHLQNGYFFGEVDSTKTNDFGLTILEVNGNEIIKRTDLDNLIPYDDETSSSDRKNKIIEYFHNVTGGKNGSNDLS